MKSQDEKLRRLIAEQAAEWHVAHEEGALDPRQARAFMSWLRTSPLHVAEYLTIASIARDASDAACLSTASLDELLAGGDESIRPLEWEDEGDTRPAATSSSRVRRVAKAAEKRPRRARPRPFF